MTDAQELAMAKAELAAVDLILAEVAPINGTFIVPGDHIRFGSFAGDRTNACTLEYHRARLTRTITALTTGVLIDG